MDLPPGSCTVELRAAAAASGHLHRAGALQHRSGSTTRSTSSSSATSASRPRSACWTLTEPSPSTSPTSAPTSSSSTASTPAPKNSRRAPSVPADRRNQLRGPLPRRRRRCRQSSTRRPVFRTARAADLHPRPDPGVTTTVTCVDAQIDCDFDPLTSEASRLQRRHARRTPVRADRPDTPGAGAFAVAYIPPSLGGTRARSRLARP